MGGGQFGTKRPRVRIPPLRQSPEALIRKASGDFSFSPEMWKNGGNGGKTGGRICAKVPGSRARQRFAAG